MKTNPVKRALREERCTYGAWLSLGDLLAARVMARAGFDWLTVDMEHSPIDWSQTAMICGAVAEAGCVPIVRVPQGSHDHIKRALDAGAWGIIAPMIDTVEQAQAVIRACKYPPAGNRSIGGNTHALAFEAEATEYYRRANDEILVVLQTESPTAIAHAEEIFSLPGVDAMFIGPNDLRANMRSADGADPSQEAFEAAIAQVVAIGKKLGTPTGIYALGPEDAHARAEQGMQFITVGSELRFMTHRAQEAMKILRPQEAAKEIGKY